MSLVLSCDLGGTSLRCGLVDADGEIRHLASRPGPVLAERAGGLETDAADWWRELRAAVEALSAASGSAFDAVAAVAVTGVTRTQILLAGDGEPLRPAITWGDARAGALLDEIRGQLPASHPETAQLNAFHPLARLHWLARHEPRVLALAGAVLEPKDYVNYRLTGRCATDRISSTRLFAAARPVGAEGSLFAALGIDPGIVPEALEPTATLGVVRPGLPGALARLAGRPVMAMTHDTWASVLGLGALRDVYAYNLSGTTEVFGVLSREPSTAEGLMSVDWGEGLQQLGGPSQSGADSLAWALELLSRDAVAPGSVGAELDRLLAAPRRPEPLIFLPYLQGERTPYWNPALRGAFVGLNRHHRAVDCLHAVFEGVGFLNRIVLERAEAANGREVSEIRFGGGGAGNAVWCQVKSDICERPFAVTRCPEPGLLGCAIVAFAALGEIASLAEGQERLVTVARRHEPEAARQADYRRLYALFRRAETALEPISAALSAWKRASP